MNDTKWVDGQEPKAGQYIQPKIYFTPEVITTEHEGTKRTHTQLHRRWDGAGRFKHGVAIGSTPKGEPITMLIDIRVGKKPSDNTSNKAISKLEF